MLFSAGKLPFQANSNLIPMLKGLLQILNPKKPFKYFTVKI